MEHPRTERYFWPAAVALLAGLAALQFHAAAQEAQTYDEGTHIGAGISYWKTGDFRLNVEHPPLAKLLATLPLLATPAQFDLAGEGWTKPDQVEAGRGYLYRNPVPADRLLLTARSVIIAMTVLLALAVALWTRSKAGATAALGALFLLALDPNLIAHGHYVTTDVPVALGIFLAVVTWVRYLESGRGWDLALAAAALGAAAAIKFSALFLVPLHLALWVYSSWRSRRWRVVAPVLLLLGAIAFVGACYGRATVRAFLENPRKPLATLRDHHPYMTGLRALREHNASGHRAYLLGKVSDQGRWQYFPAAFAVKTPAVPLLLMAALPFLLRGPWPLWRIAFLLYPAAYFVLSMAGNINIGIRHLLPLYPFLYALLGSIWARLPKAALVLGAVSVFEVARIHPDHLAFFNLLAGGPDAGPRYLLDSNIDWGQDVKKLKRYMDAHSIRYVRVAYFGQADLAYYGIDHGILPGAWDTSELAAIDDFAVASVTNLYDVYFDRPTYSWLRQYRPVAVIGHSLYVYDLRKKRP